MLMAPDWQQWRKCPVCHAETGVACRSLSGGGPDRRQPVQLEHPHLDRKARTSAGRPVVD